MSATAADVFKFITSDGFDHAGKAAEAVKKMQELEAGQSQFHSAREHFKSRINYPSTPQQQNNMDNATILAEQYDELIAIYKKIDTSVFVEFPKFLLDKIPELTIKHYELLADSSYTRNMNYGEIAELLGEIHDDFFQVVALIGAMMILDNDYQKIKNAAQIFNTEKENFNALKDTMMNKHESWEKDNLKLKEEIADLKKESEDALKSTKDALKSAKIVSSKAGADAHAAFFAKQADVHEKEQGKWLARSVVVTLILLSLILLSSLSDVWETKTTLQAVSKTLIFSLLLSVLIFCVKNYKAHGHNYIVNTHRANSLQTYEAIVKGAISSDTHDIILEQAAKCIFTQLDTGYIKDMNNAGNPVVETIKNVVKSGNEKG